MNSRLEYWWRGNCAQVKLDVSEAAFFLRSGFQIVNFFSKIACSDQLQIVDFKFFWRFGSRIFTEPVIRGCKQRFLVKYLQALFTEQPQPQLLLLHKQRWGLQIGWNIQIRCPRCPGNTRYSSRSPWTPEQRETVARNKNPENQKYALWCALPWQVMRCDAMEKG